MLYKQRFATNMPTKETNKTKTKTQHSSRHLRNKHQTKRRSIRFRKTIPSRKKSKNCMPTFFTGYTTYTRSTGSDRKAGTVQRGNAFMWEGDEKSELRLE
jgi:hypothetical protein